MSFSVTCNFIIVIPGKKYLLPFFFQVIVLYIFWKNKKMLSSAAVIIRGLHLWYNIYNIRYILSNKRFKALLESQMTKDKTTTLLAIRNQLFWCRGLSSFLHIAIFFYKQCLFCTSVTTSHKCSLSVRVS